MIDNSIVKRNLRRFNYFAHLPPYFFLELQCCFVLYSSNIKEEEIIIHSENIFNKKKKKKMTSSTADQQKNSNKKAKKEESPSNAGKSKSQQPEPTRTAAKKKHATFEIPYPFPPYTGGTGITEADDIYDEMQRIVHDKTMADPNCWAGISLISLKYEDGPHFASNVQANNHANGINTTMGQSLFSLLQAKSNEDAAAAAAAAAQQQHQNQPAAAATTNGVQDMDPSCTIHVYGLPHSAGESDVRVAFSAFPIKSIHIPMYNKNNSGRYQNQQQQQQQQQPQHHRSMCYVEFADQKSADVIKAAPPGTFTVCDVPVRVSAYLNFAAAGAANDDENDDENSAGNNASNNNNNTSTAQQQQGNGSGGVGGGDEGGSRVAAITNLVPEGEAIDEELIELIGQDCSKYGEVRNITFYRASDDDAGVTCAVEFGSHKEALACVQKMNGRSFDKRILISGLMDMALYKVVAQTA